MLQEALIYRKDVSLVLVGTGTNGGNLRQKSKSLEILNHVISTNIGALFLCCQTLKLLQYFPIYERV